MTKTLATNFFTSFSQNKLLMALWGAFLLSLCSQISIPLNPVPITLQSIGVMLIGLTFTKEDAVRSVITYLLLGSVGLPVFANFSGGLPILFGPTGGYLLGFLLAVYIMGIAREYFESNSLIYILGLCMLGTSAIFLCGVAWLTKFIGVHEAFYLGLVPFIIPGIAKALLLSLCIKYINFGQFFKI